jgi:hypothetical protein
MLKSFIGANYLRNTWTRGQAPARENLFALRSQGGHHDAVMHGVEQRLIFASKLRKKHKMDELIKAN